MSACPKSSGLECRNCVSQNAGRMTPLRAQMCASRSPTLRVPIGRSGAAFIALERTRQNKLAEPFADRPGDRRSLSEPPGLCLRWLLILAAPVSLTVVTTSANVLNVPLLPCAVASTSAEPPLKMPLNPVPVAAKAAEPSHDSSVNASPWINTRPARCVMNTSTKTSAAMLHVTVPRTVTSPVLLTTVPRGSTVRSNANRGCGGTFGSNANGALAGLPKLMGSATAENSEQFVGAQSI